MSACATGDLGAVRNMLAAVDCNTHDFARLGYQALTGTGSPFQAALTVFLTLYVAAIGYRLLFASGEARLSDGAMTALKVGAILALVTNWSVFQTLVYDVTARVPLEIAAVIAAPLDAKSTLTADPAGGLQVAYDQLLQASAAFGKSDAAHTDSGRASAAEALTIAANTVFLGSAGQVAMANIAVAILTAVGPVFIALFLFAQTRGLFVGWVRALAASACAIFTTWTAIVLMLYVLEPWLVALAEQRQAGQLDTQYAMTAAAIVFVFAASQLGLVLAGFAVARGFSLDTRARRTPAAAPVRVENSSPLPSEIMSRATRLAERLKYDNPDGGTRRTAITTAHVTRAAGPAIAFDTGRESALLRRPAMVSAARGDKR